MQRSRYVSVTGQAEADGHLLGMEISADVLVQVGLATALFVETPAADGKNGTFSLLLSCDDSGVAGRTADTRMFVSIVRTLET